MTSTCKDRLMEIEYFMARNFSLDLQLYQACNQDTQDICQANDQWYAETDAQNHQLVFACLARNLHNEVEENEDLPSLSDVCANEVKRVLEQVKKKSKVKIQKWDNKVNAQDDWDDKVNAQDDWTENDFEEIRTSSIKNDGIKVPRNVLGKFYESFEEGGYMYWLLYIALHAVFTFRIIGYSITGLLDVGLSIYEAFILAKIIREKLLAGEPYEEERLRLQNIVQNFLPRWNNGNNHNNQME